MGQQTKLLDYTDEMHQLILKLNTRQFNPTVLVNRGVALGFK